MAVLLLAPLLTSCGDGASRVAAPRAFGDPPELIAWVNVTSAESHAGETVQIDVGVRNPTRLPIIAVVHAPCISYVVNDLSGAAAAGGYSCLPN